MKKILVEWYGPDAQKSPDLCRIVNVRHFQYGLILSIKVTLTREIQFYFLYLGVL